MKTINLHENWDFNPKGPQATPLHVDRNGRAILFTLKPGQMIREHNAPSSPFYAVVLSGRGTFAGGDGIEQTVEPGQLIVFEPAEQHTIHAIDDLVFVGCLHGVPASKGSA
jgi:quercetin dioxygenase-like cupin family protein